jgi:WD40 repeat protein
LEKAEKQSMFGTYHYYIQGNVYQVLIFSDFSIQVVDAEDWKVRSILQIYESASSTMGIMSFSEDGSLLASSPESGRAEIWIVLESEMLWTLQLFEAPPNRVNPTMEIAFSPNGHWLAITGNGLVHLYGVGKN